MIDVRNRIAFTLVVALTSVVISAAQEGSPAPRSKSALNESQILDQLIQQNQQLQKQNLQIEQQNQQLEKQNQELMEQIKARRGAEVQGANTSQQAVATTPAQTTTGSQPQPGGTSAAQGQGDDKTLYPEASPGNEAI